MSDGEYPKVGDGYRSVPRGFCGCCLNRIPPPRGERKPKIDCQLLIDDERHLGR